MTVKSRVDVDPVFERQIRALRAACAGVARSVLSGDRPRWMTPELFDWSGDTNDWDGMSAAFDRSQANEQFAAAIADAGNPGTVADLMAATTMIDYLGCMERAYRARHALPANRAALHMASRLAGHGDERGALTVCGLEYVRRLVRQAKGLQGES